jgi:hypothetical protein
MSILVPTDNSAPVNLNPSSNRIELRLDEGSQSRISNLTASDARLLAHRLLVAAEELSRLEDSN